MNRNIKALIAGAVAVAGFCTMRTLLGKRPPGLMKAAETAPAADEKELHHSMEPVEAASEDSFPASDPPGWTGTTGSIV